jgi:hypothetical protein
MALPGEVEGTQVASRHLAQIRHRTGRVATFGSEATAFVTQRFQYDIIIINICFRLYPATLYQSPILLTPSRV